MPKKIPQHMQSSCANCEAREFAWFEPGESTDSLLIERQKHRSSQIQLEVGEYLFREGENNQAAYTLKEGWAICYKQLENGQRQVVHIALPGDFLGYQSDYSIPIDYSVIANTNCVLCSFTPTAIDSLLKTDIGLIKRLMEIQNKQIAACKRKLSIIGQAQTKHKIAYFLVDLVRRLKQRGIKIDDVISIPLNREDIADAIGITPVHLSRVIVELHNDNIMECRHSKLKVNNLEELQRLAGVTKKY